MATNSICTPSRAAILTGQYSHLNGVPVFNRFDSSQRTVASLLQQGGYYTGMIGKWHLGSDPVGFDRWEILPGQGAYQNPILYTATGEKTYTGRYATDVITDLSIEFIRSRPRNKPFFLMSHHKAPHRPWEPDEAHRRGIRRSLDSRAGHVLGRLRHPDGRAARKPAARGRRSEQPRPQAAAAAGPDRPGADCLAHHEAGVRHDSPWQRNGDADRRGAGALEVPALHAGLSRDRAVARRQHRAAARLPRRVGPLAEHDRHLHQRPGILPRRSRPLRQALHVRRSAADAVSRALARRPSNPARGAARSP